MFLRTVLSRFPYYLIKEMHRRSASALSWFYLVLSISDVIMGPVGPEIDFRFFCYFSHECYFAGNGNGRSKSILSESRHKSSVTPGGRADAAYFFCALNIFKDR